MKNQHKCSCVLCHYVTTSANIKQHFNSKRCKDTQKFPNRKKGFCPHCNMKFDEMSVSESANHTQWCKLAPHIDQKKNEKRLICQTVMATKEVQIRKKATKQKRYGDENYNNVRKNKATKLERYGSENYIN